MSNKQVIHTATFLNEMGDLTIGWTEEQSENVAKIIEKKMSEGIRFFVVSPLTKEELEVKSLSDIRGYEVKIKDEDIIKLLSDGKVEIFKTVPQLEMDVIQVATTAKEVVENTTIATKPMRGG